MTDTTFGDNVGTGHASKEGRGAGEGKEGRRGPHVMLKLHHWHMPVGKVTLSKSHRLELESTLDLIFVFTLTHGNEASSQHLVVPHPSRCRRGPSRLPL